MNFKSFLGAAVLLAALTLGVADAADQQPYAWQNVPFGGGGYVPGFLYHPRQKGLLYARTDVGGMYRYDYSTKSWIQLLDHLPHDDGDLSGVLSMAIDPNDPNKLYAATGLYLSQWARKGAILRSNDQGRTWLKAELPIRVGGNSDGRGMGDRLAVDPRNGKVLWYGSNQDGLWKSTDGGETFSHDSSPATSISLVAISPASGEIFLGSVDAKGALLVSSDNGREFKRVTATPDQVPQHVAFAADGSVYVTFAEAKDNQALNPSNAFDGSVWKRDASGKWSDITPTRPDANFQFGYSGIDVGPDGTVAVSTIDHWNGGDDILLSRDGGAHWLSLKDKSHHDYSVYRFMGDIAHDKETMFGWISDVKINPFNKDELIYCGPWMSRNLSDAGTGKPVEWDFQTRDLEETVIMQLVAPLRGPRVMAAMGDDAGAAWYDTAKVPNETRFKPAAETSRSIDYTSAGPLLMVRTADNSPYAYTSEDGGKTWQAMPATPYKPAKDWHDWHSPGVIAVSAKGTSMVWAPEKEDAHYSTDKGRTWQPCAGWPASGHERQLTVLSDKAADGVFYVFDPAGNIYASIDGGAHFQVIVNGLPKVETWQQSQLVPVPGRFRDLWLVAPYGLLHSPNSQVSMGNIKAVTDAWSVGFGAPMVQGGYPAIYLWGKVRKQEGIWRSDDEGQTWIRINDDLHQVGGPIAGDMREPGVVYLAAGGRGLRVGKPVK